jgi:type IV fimbrial biogenesis protein FimT
MNTRKAQYVVSPIGRCDRPYRGFTLLELMLVITIAAVLSGIGIPSFTRLIADQRIIVAASEFQMALWRTRSEAIRLNRAVTLTPADGKLWESGWVALDPTIANHELIHRDPLVGVIVSSRATSLVYRPSGRLGGTAQASFEIASKTSSTPEKRCVRIDLSGQPMMLKQGCSP